jgi:hypothetical protein
MGLGFVWPLQRDMMAMKIDFTRLSGIACLV